MLTSTEFAEAQKLDQARRLLYVRDEEYVVCRDQLADAVAKLQSATRHLLEVTESLDLHDHDGNAQRIREVTSNLDTASREASQLSLDLAWKMFDIRRLEDRISDLAALSGLPNRTASFRFVD